MNGRRVATATLDGVLVGVDARLEGGAATIEEVVGIGRAVISAALCGVAEEAFARTARYLKERRQFDRRIGSFEALQHRAARVHIEIENAWSATLQALQSIEAAPIPSRSTSRSPRPRQARRRARRRPSACRCMAASA
jgi:acyl-CoA dehydrogenase